MRPERPVQQVRSAGESRPAVENKPAGERPARPERPVQPTRSAGENRPAGESRPQSDRQIRQDHASHGTRYNEGKGSQEHQPRKRQTGIWTVRREETDHRADVRSETEETDARREADVISAEARAHGRIGETHAEMI